MKKLRRRGEEEGRLHRFEREIGRKHLVAGLDHPANPPFIVHSLMTTFILDFFFT